MIGNNGAKKSHFGPIEKLTRTLPSDGFFLVSSPEEVGSKVQYHPIASLRAKISLFCLIVLTKIHTRTRLLLVRKY